MERPPIKLDKTSVEALPLTNRRYKVMDAQIPGFQVRVSPSGAKSFLYEYRARGGRGSPMRTITIGRFPKMTADKARRKAMTYAGQVAAGDDPQAELSAARQRLSSDRFDLVLEDFITLYAEKKNKTAKETRRILTREALTEFGKRSVHDITKADIARLIRNTETRAPYTARSLFAQLRRMFNWLVEQGVLEQTPMYGMKSPGKAVARDRILTARELAAVWQAMDEMPFPFGPMFQLLTLTGQRRGEVVGMRWSEIDLEARTWTLPKERTKNGIRHEVPLSQTAVEIIRAIPILDETLVFITNGKNPVSGFSKAKRAIDARAAELLEIEEMELWRTHDLRRTFASGCARLRIQLPAIERLLNHVSGSFAGIVGVYQHYDFAGEKREAVEKWAIYLCNIGQPRTQANTASYNG